MFKKLTRASALTLALLVIVASIALAAWTPESFDAFTAVGFAPDPAAGQLDSDAWRVTGFSDGDGIFGGTHTAGDFARGVSTGGVTIGGVYAFNVGGGDIILGVQPGGTDFTPGAITLKVQNTTGGTLTDIYVSYTIWVFNDQDRSNSLNLYYSTDDSTYTPIAALDFNTPEALDPTPAWTSTSRSTTISGLSLAPDADFYIQWQSDDVSGTGSRDEFGIDDVEVRADGATAVTLSSLSGSSAPFAGLAAALVLAAGLVLLRKRK